MKASFLKPEFWKTRGYKRKGEKRLPKSLRDSREAVTARGAIGYVGPVYAKARVLYWSIFTLPEPVPERFETRKGASDYLRAWRIMNGYNEHGL